MAARTAIFTANPALVEGLGAHYVITAATSMVDGAANHGPFDLVLGNTLMLGTANASREDFEQDVRDMIQADATFPGFQQPFLTHPIDGLENFANLFDALTNAKDAIEVYCVVGKMK